MLCGQVVFYPNTYLKAAENYGRDPIPAMLNIPKFKLTKHEQRPKKQR